MVMDIWLVRMRTLMMVTWMKMMRSSKMRMRTIMWKVMSITSMRIVKNQIKMMKMRRTMMMTMVMKTMMIQMIRISIPLRETTFKDNLDMTMALMMRMRRSKSYCN
jgi:hypothetical protein